MPSPPLSRDDFEVAIICALDTEYNAVSLILDDFWDISGDPYGRLARDHNMYTTGRIGKWDVVLALLPHMGKVDAATAAATMRMSYPGLKLALLVGVCGGVPRIENEEVLLGDVILSETIVQYDFGRQYPVGFVRKNTVCDNLGRANKDIRGLLAMFRTDPGMESLEERTASILRELQAKAVLKRRSGNKYNYPGTGQDMLFEPAYHHKHRTSAGHSCDECDGDIKSQCDEALRSSCADLKCAEDHLVARRRLEDKRQLEQEDSAAAQQPAIYVGAVASGDMVMKSGVHRDAIAKKEAVIAFEMEGAGVWDEVPCIVVKGVCDYADSHKHKGWQNFAAATAASVAKAILERYIQSDKIPQFSRSESPKSQRLRLPLTRRQQRGTILPTRLKLPNTPGCRAAAQRRHSTGRSRGTTWLRERRLPEVM